MHYQNVSLVINKNFFLKSIKAYLLIQLVDLTINSLFFLLLMKSTYKCICSLLLVVGSELNVVLLLDWLTHQSKTFQSVLLFEKLDPCSNVLVVEGALLIVNVNSLRRYLYPAHLFRSGLLLCYPYIFMYTRPQIKHHS